MYFENRRLSGGFFMRKKSHYATIDREASHVNQEQQ